MGKKSRLGVASVIGNCSSVPVNPGIDPWVWFWVAMAEDKFNRRNPSVKRILQEVKEMQSNPCEDFMSFPLEENIFEWQFAIRGPRDSEFDGGIYHGRIQLPAEYPLKPPSFMLLTPNGRFETQKKICLSISNHHPEHWQPSWSVRTALTALIAFMPTPPNGALGSLDYTKEERKALAIKSREQAPNFGNEERQKLIIEIHEYMLSKTSPLPQSNQDSETKTAIQLNHAQQNPEEDTTFKETTEIIPPPTEGDDINIEEAHETRSTSNVLQASTSSEQEQFLIKPETRAPKPADDRMLTWAALGLTFAIVVLLLKKFLKANGHSAVFMDES